MLNRRRLACKDSYHGNVHCKHFLLVVEVHQYGWRIASVITCGHDWLLQMHLMIRKLSDQFSYHLSIMICGTRRCHAPTTAMCCHNLTSPYIGHTSQPRQLSAHGVPAWDTTTPRRMGSELFGWSPPATGEEDESHSPSSRVGPG